MFHPILDRYLGASILKFLLRGEKPVVSLADANYCADALNEYARSSWEISPAETVGKVHFSTVLKDNLGQRIGLWVINPLMARPSEDKKTQVFAQSGIRCAVHNTFDLQRRTFWVLNNLL